MFQLAAVKPADIVVGDTDDAVIIATDIWLITGEAHEIALDEVFVNEQVADGPSAPASFPGQQTLPAFASWQRSIGRRLL